jgi:hypothetical protein
MPPEGKDPQYHIKSTDDGHERMVFEAYLRPYLANRTTAPVMFSTRETYQAAAAHDVDQEQETTQEALNAKPSRSTRPAHRRSKRAAPNRAS